MKPRKKNISIRKYKKGRLSGYEAATGRAVKWFKGRARATKAKRAAKRRNPIPAGKALAFSSKAAARSYAKKNGLKGYRILKATKPR